MARRCLQSLALLMAVILLAVLTTASETVALEVTTAQTTREQVFRETLDTYKPASSDESAVIALLKTYRDAYNVSDLSRIEVLLAPNFELRYYERFFSEKYYTVMVQSRAKYLEKRSPWSPKEPRGEKLIVRVLNVLLHPEGKGAVVVAATTYKSKYFHPRYIETFGFKRTSDGWLLRRILVVPAQPKPEEHEVNISYATVDDQYLPDDILAARGPDALFKKYIQLSCCLSTVRQKLIIIFAEPPPENTQIVVTETTYGGSEFESISYVDPSSPYFFLLGKGWRGSDISVGVEVMVDGVIVARTRLY